MTAMSGTKLQNRPTTEYTQMTACHMCFPAALAVTDRFIPRGSSVARTFTIHPRLPAHRQLRAQCAKQEGALMFRKFPEHKSMPRWVGTAGVISVLACCAEAALAANFHEPPVFASQNGVLDILMIAKPKPIPTISFAPPHSRTSINPIGWAYEICKRPASGLTCPTGSGVWDYGSLRFAPNTGRP